MTCGYRVINFYKIIFVKILWDEESSKILSIDFVDKMEKGEGDVPYKLIPVIYFLSNYFDYETAPFSLDLFETRGISVFYMEIYNKLMGIKKGETITYGDLATMTNHHGAARAVGSAMAKNRFPLVIPCHRVLSRNSLGGFSAGLRIKEQLLLMEKMKLD